MSLATTSEPPPPATASLSPLTHEKKPPLPVINVTNETTKLATTATTTTSTTTTTSQPGANNGPTATSTPGAGANNAMARLLAARPATAAATAGGTSDPLKSEMVRKNWKTVLDVAMKKRNELIENETAIRAEPLEIYATEKENWVFFSIIVTVVVVLSVLVCLFVYWFFPKFRGRPY